MVLYNIENNIRGQSAINAVLKETNGSGEEYTVIFTINNKDFSSIWIREYGNWRIKSFGSVASGDKSLISKKEEEKKSKENLRIDEYNTHLEIGYANLFEKSPTAMYFSFSYSVLGLNLYYVDSDFWAFGVYPGWRWGIPAGNFGFMPYIRAGILYMHDSGYEDYEKIEPVKAGFPMAFSGQVGLKITTSYVPGLFVGTAFQINIFNLTDYEKRMKQAFSVSVGYAF